jgi:hypothetical protein
MTNPVTTVATAVKSVATQLHTPGNAFLLPDNTVRYLIVAVVVLGYLWMQWHSPTEGAVPQELVGIAGIVTGYALAGKGSPTMKALVSIVFVFAEVAFLLNFKWAPGTITGQVSLIVGTYFGAAEKKQAGETP